MRMTTMGGLLGPGLMGLFLAAAPGCAPGSGEEAPSGARLGSVQVPEGFDFATQREVALVLPEGSFAWSGALLEVNLPAGDRIYTGPVTAGAELRFPLATAVDELWVRVRTAERDETLEVPVRDGRAVLNLD